MQLTSRLRVKILLNYQLKNDVSWADFNTYKRIFNWKPFMNRVCQKLIKVRKRMEDILRLWIIELCYARVDQPDVT